MPYRPSSTSLLVVAFLLVSILAVVQVRWIHALGRGEAERVRQAMTERVEQVAAELGTELGAIERAHRSGADHESSLAGALGEAHARWREGARDPELVSALVWVDESGVAHRLDPATGTFEPHHWSNDQAEWARVARALATPSGRVVEVPSHPPGLVVPLLGPSRGSLLVLLDDVRLATNLLPALVAERFGRAFDPPARVIVWSGDRVAGRVPDVDFSVPEEPDASAVVGAGMNVEIFSVDDGEQVTVRRAAGADMLERFRDGAERGLDDAVRHDVIAPVWRVDAYHAAGSVARAVRTANLRNLALGLGILGLLGVAAAALFFSERRNRAAAEREAAWVAGVTHELRTPLMAIRSAAENLADGVVATPERTREYGRILRDESDRLSGLVEQTLALAAAAENGAEPRLERIDLTRFLPEVVERVGRTSPGGAPELFVPPDTPPVRAERRNLDHAISNLLGNARKYGGDRHGVRVTTDGRAVRLTVWDDGEGVPDAERERVFDPFYRGETARRSDRPGAGLGLSVARRSLESFGATVHVDADSNSAFTITLQADER